jgi:(p)ppGpp synthase/HD superfamily hydrolase
MGRKVLIRLVGRKEKNWYVMITQRVIRAAKFATWAHDGQRRKYIDEPYVLHPFRVVDLLLDVGIDDADMLCTAFLHDVLEDCPDKVRPVDIQENFGVKVLSMVTILTDPPKFMGNRKVRKEMTLERFRHYASAKEQTIKVADLLDNAESIVMYDKNFGPRFLQEKSELLDVLTRANVNLYFRAQCELSRLTEYIQTKQGIYANISV